MISAKDYTSLLLPLPCFPFFNIDSPLASPQLPSDKHSSGFHTVEGSKASNLQSAALSANQPALHGKAKRAQSPSRQITDRGSQKQKPQDQAESLRNNAVAAKDSLDRDAGPQSVSSA